MVIEGEAKAETEGQEVGSSEKHYERLEDLPGVGPATAQKLRELGFHTVESLATATIRELEPAGIGEKKAFEVIKAARSAISKRGSFNLRKQSNR
jgi:DNA repair protein RadA